MRIIIRETGMIEQSCPCGIGHPTREGIDYMSKSTCSTKKVWEVHGCCMIPGHCWIVDRDNEKGTKSMLQVRKPQRTGMESSVQRVHRPRTKQRRSD